MSNPRIIVSAPVPADLRAQLEAKFQIVDVPAGKSPVEALDAGQLRDISGGV